MGLLAVISWWEVINDGEDVNSRKIWVVVICIYIHVHLEIMTPTQ